MPDEQLPLFEVGEYQVAAPTRPQRRGKPHYRRLTLTCRLPCDDCVALLHAHAWVGPAPLPAAWLRTDRDGNLWLCHPHTQQWQLMEARAEQQQ